jgi:hypothetical protein
VPVLRELSGKGFRGSALVDLGYRGKRLVKAGQKLGITVKPIARGRDGKFLPTGICVTGRSRPPYKDLATEIAYVVNDVVMDVNNEVRYAGGGAEWK